MLLQTTYKSENTNMAPWHAQNSRKFTIIVNIVMLIIMIALTYSMLNGLLVIKSQEH